MEFEGLFWVFFISFLLPRQQYVDTNNDRSYLKLLNCDLPKKSILGPLFFINFKNHQYVLSPILGIYLIVDDTNA